ncbi:MAG: LamB/YcsF family protein [Gemmatimonadetes bacterium]|nr:LamB/YcsF family protein [Gemmatimonadota bacterium]
MRHVDLNCDMGESFGAWRMGDDDAILPHISSANIACGFHAGDPTVMRRTVEAAAAHGVAIGAHPGLPDLAGFGRRVMEVTPEEAYDLVVYQMGALAGVARACGSRVAHVKVHGALYNMAARRAPLAAAIARAVRDVDPTLFFFGLSGSVMVAEAERCGLVAVHEVFADRAYEPDGSLTPRHVPGALVADAGVAAARVVRLVESGEVVARDGSVIRLQANTVCVHGDGADAVGVASALAHQLRGAGIAVRAPARSEPATRAERSA